MKRFATAFLMIAILAVWFPFAVFGCLLYGHDNVEYEDIVKKRWRFCYRCLQLDEILIGDVTCQ